MNTSHTSAVEPNDRSASRARPAVLLRAEGLVRSYARGCHAVLAIDDVSLEVAEGEFVAIMGPSGSGKTTLLALLGGLDRPTRGHVRFRDRRYTDLAEADLAELRRRHIGLVLQDPCLVNALSALDNVRLPLLFDRRLHDSDRAVAWLDRLGLGARHAHFPHELSAGESQRVGIARALVNGPRLLLADEPTGNLDANASRDTFQILHDLCRAEGVTVIVATHDPAIEPFADRRVRLADGRIASDGAA